MTWKRCHGCTRAISANAFACEYCGQLCDAAMHLLPTQHEPGREATRGDELTAGDGAARPAVDTPDLQQDQPPVAASAALAKPGAPLELSLPRVKPTASDDASVTSRRPSIADARETPLLTPSLPVPSAVADLGLDDQNWGLFDHPAEGAVAGGAGPASGHVAPSAFAHTDPDFMAFEVEETPAPAAGGEAIPATVAAGEPLSARRFSPRQVAMAGGAVMAASALLLTSLSMRGSASPDAAAPVTARPALVKPAPRNAAAAPLATDAPKWSRVTDGRWVGTSRHAAAFEVRAINRVHVWMRDVTPLLVVRCDAGVAEAFVFTQSAARMEPQDGDHTVRLTFDDGVEITERWPDSAEHDALFAGNQGAFTERLAHSSSLRFGFTPHNADRVTATFAVGGLADLMKSAARQCGVKP